MTLSISIQVYPYRYGPELSLAEEEMKSGVVRSEAIRRLAGAGG
jgi:hypothetical protein